MRLERLGGLHWRRALRSAAWPAYGVSGGGGGIWVRSGLAHAVDQLGASAALCALAAAGLAGSAVLGALQAAAGRQFETSVRRGHLSAGMGRLGREAQADSCRPRQVACTATEYTVQCNATQRNATQCNAMQRSAVLRTLLQRLLAVRYTGVLLTRSLHLHGGPPDGTVGNGSDALYPAGAP